MTLLAAASCSKDPGEVVDTKTASLKIVLGDLTTKADAGRVGDDYVTTIGANNGYIFIFDANGAVVAGSGTALALVDNPVVGDSDTYQIVETTDNAKQVVVVANAPAAIENAATLSLAQLQAQIFALSAVAPATGATSGVENAMLYNDAALNVVPAVTNGVTTELEATVNIVPAFARIEVIAATGNRGLTETEVGDGYLPLEAFTLGAIYLNNVASAFSMNGPVTNETYPFVNELTPTTREDTWSWDALTGADVTNVDQSVVPTNGAWAYHFAGGSSPRIVFSVSDITIGTEGENNVTQIPGPLYLNVKFKTSAEAEAPEVTFERGNVYRIANIIFNYPDLAETTSLTEVSLTAIVTVEPWVIDNTIVPNFGPDVTP